VVTAWVTALGAVPVAPLLVLVVLVVVLGVMVVGAVEGATVVVVVAAFVPELPQPDSTVASATPRTVPTTATPDRRVVARWSATRRAYR